MITLLAEYVVKNYAIIVCLLWKAKERGQPTNFIILLCLHGVRCPKNTKKKTTRFFKKRKIFLHYLNFLYFFKFFDYC